MIRKKLFPALGFIFCVVMLFYKESDNALCFSNGCALFASFDIMGISLWYFGALSFLMLLIWTNKYFALSLVLFDCVFLAIMQLGLPCVNCMIAGIFFLLSFLFLKDNASKPIPVAKYIVIYWLFLLVLNIGSLLNEYGDYRLCGKNNTRLYFSPNCISCLEALKEYPVAGLYPVAESSADLAVIYAMKTFLNDGIEYSRALTLARENPKSPPFWFEWILWKNKGRVLEFGGVTPLIIKSGFVVKKRNFIRDFSFER